MPETELHSDESARPAGRAPARGRFVMRVAVLSILVLAVAAMWVTNLWMTDRFTETTRVRTELRLALYTGNVISELQRTSVVPLLLARDPELTRALETGDFSGASARLISARKEIAAASIRMLDTGGRVVAATNRNLLGTNYSTAPFFVDALRSRETIFTAAPTETGGTGFN